LNIGQSTFDILYDVKMKFYKYRGIKKNKLVQFVTKMPIEIQYNHKSTCIICLDDVYTAKYINCFHDICLSCVNEYNEIECPICRHSCLLI
jgi:hypothetical protein